ncbi:response regulator [Engelhardtia mirabilis]|uniref:DNA-binding transcriptional regulator PhoP n=1 Tax=Engelhardtia mirabilis TaxID=2528011 RepID=A0A518BSR4_9BACT|nr:DNA-binding transcriptional regulator PhoP [Planctomycetes bacterium Pla133]QDV04342.1 DNA-binding transcriptional regulator PhoP [Planctomycetes bacterium Pla86]
MESSGAEPPRGRHVLLVDGDRARAEQTHAALEHLGHRVSIASGVREALRHPLPQVAVVALGLPDGDGLELLSELRRRGGELAAVLYADRPTFDQCRRAWHLGACDLLTTPVATEDLGAALGRIEAGVGGRQAARAATGDRWTSPDEEHDGALLREILALGVCAGLGPAARARLAGAASEALDNARRHAFAGGPGQVSVEPRVASGRVHLTITDGGAGFDPLRGELDAIAPAMPGGSARPGGLARLRALADDLRIESAPGQGTRIELRVDPHPAALDGGAGTDLSDRDYLDPDLARRLLHELCEPDGGTAFDLPPALAVALGRLAAATDPSRLAQRALWS